MTGGGNDFGEKGVANRSNKNNGGNVLVMCVEIGDYWGLTLGLD